MSVQTPLRATRSVCPVCLRNIPAILTRREDGCILMEKNCPEHGSFRVPVWQGTMDFDQWILGTAPLSAGGGMSCPGHCGICGAHQSSTCCTLLEVTRRCNLRCRYCFAEGGISSPDPSANEMKAAIRVITDKCGQPLIQFSGGEPTLRNDLPELVRYAREAGCSYTQVNTNGIRLAEDPSYTRQLAEAGLDIVFLQFDGVTDDIYRTLRGKPLLETKLAAIRICSDLHIGVTLVPTVVKGVNDHQLGDIISLACRLAPGVRGIHFQPVSYFGRYPDAPTEENRYTLDQLMTDISDQAGIPAESFLPSRCDHPLCGFHSRFFIEPGGKLKPLSSITHAARNKGSAKDNREYIARNWKGVQPLAGNRSETVGTSAYTGTRSEPADRTKSSKISDSMDFDTFLHRMRHQSLTMTSMAFQDAMNLNIERLQHCSLHVYDNGIIKPFCSKYLTPIKAG